jgi:hypothetical protein
MKKLITTKGVQDQEGNQSSTKKMNTTRGGHTILRKAPKLNKEDGLKKVDELDQE